MEGVASEYRLVRLAGILTWCVVGLPSVGASLPWTVTWLVFGAAFWWTTRPDAAHDIAGLLAQSLAACGLVALGTTGLDAACFVLVAGQLPSMLPGTAAYAWMGAQTAVLAACFAGRARLSQALVVAGAYGGFQVFAYGAAAMAEREARARRELARLNAELRAAQEMLQGATRLGERVRIAGELHDALGHHLTALSLNLEVAGHLTEGPAAEHVARAHALTRLLLADVRAMVGTLREDASMDLAGSLRSLVEGLPAPRVELVIPDGLELRDPALAHTVFRCVQEAVTNAVRHSGAANLRISVEWGLHGLEVRVEDDGRGAEGPSLGNGLCGMRERLERLGGTLQLDTAPRAGFRLKALLPIPSEAP
jgi:signal transduction histidine kinase